MRGRRLVCRTLVQPQERPHGGPNARNRRSGHSSVRGACSGATSATCNIEAGAEASAVRFKDQYVSLKPGKEANIVGRSVVIRERADDFVTQGDQDGDAENPLTAPSDPPTREDARSRIVYVLNNTHHRADTHPRSPTPPLSLSTLLGTFARPAPSPRGSPLPALGTSPPPPWGPRAARASHRRADEQTHEPRLPRAKRLRLRGHPSRIAAHRPFTSSASTTTSPAASALPRPARRRLPLPPGEESGRRRRRPLPAADEPV